MSSIVILRIIGIGVATMKTVTVCAATGWGEVVSVLRGNMFSVITQNVRQNTTTIANPSIAKITHCVRVIIDLQHKRVDNRSLQSIS